MLDTATTWRSLPTPEHLRPENLNFSLGKPVGSYYAHNPSTMFRGMSLEEKEALWAEALGAPLRLRRKMFVSAEHEQHVREKCAASAAAKAGPSSTALVEIENGDRPLQGGKSAGGKRKRKASAVEVFPQGGLTTDSSEFEQCVECRDLPDGSA
ncbi:hypothetical protein BV25DRAFT_1899270 [Artomyces pyxidatus]|uniref:Uncharacterized protein n=1 Tax=Artomyces pyxidatus TaxID=48021 RepID=A0ACB8T5J8_9AGAM|nr:hypothetical protein BV25DRAFT_1899270 [Artomyces pyxidatus]